MKKLSVILLILFLTCGSVLFGCTHEMVSLYIYKMPDKLVYEIGEDLDISGLQLKNIKTDSALLKIYNNNANFSGFDSSSSGKKEVQVSYGKFTTSFNVFVANKVVENLSELKTTLQTLEEDDIVLIKAGEYKLPEAIEINNSKIVIGGEGKDKTKIDSFVVLGGTENEGEISFSNSCEDVSFLSLSLNTNSGVREGKIVFENNLVSENIAAINADLAKKLNVISCEFSGFSVGIKANSMENCYISSNKFTNLLVGGIETTKSTKDVTISKNIITKIGANVVVLGVDGEQENIFGIKLALNSEDNLGVSLYKNSISIIGSKNGELKFFKEKISGNFHSLNYMNNSGAIILFSTIKNNLQTKGLSVFFNSIGSSLNNILYGTNENDNVNSSSVMYMAL